MDPLSNKYAFYTPYQFAGNKPITAVDLDGEEENYRYFTEDKSGTHIKTIQHSELFPGEEHGSKGTGSLDYTLNKKTGKWDVKYRESFGDAHPIKNFLLNAQKRYEDKKGFKTFGKDLGKKVAPVIKGGGIIATAVFGPEVGIPIYKAGGYVEDLSNAIEIASDASEGKGTEVLIDIGAAAAGKIVSKTTEKLTEPIKDEVRKFAVEAATDKAAGKAIDAVKEDAKESATSSKESKKEE